MNGVTAVNIKTTMYFLGDHETGGSTNLSTSKEKDVKVCDVTHFSFALSLWNSQIIVSTPSKLDDWSVTLSEENSKLGRALAGGNLQAIFRAIKQHKDLLPLVMDNLLAGIDSECSILCKKSQPSKHDL